jgi:hypothetical protein
MLTKEIHNKDSLHKDLLMERLSMPLQTVAVTLLFEL